MSPRLRKSWCQFLLFILADEERGDVYFKKLQAETRVRVPLECIMVAFLGTNYEGLAAFAAVGIARLAVSRNGTQSKKAVRELKGISLLLEWATPNTPPQVPHSTLSLQHH